MKPLRPAFVAVLSEHKSAIVAKWLQQTLQAYPEPSVNFLAHQPDPFRNPVGHTLKASLPILFDGIVHSGEESSMRSALDDILKIRAVQDIPASRALSFIFLLKQIIRAEFSDDYLHFLDDLAALEKRTDEALLLALDLYVICRERIAELKANELRRSSFVAEKIHLKSAAGAVNVTR